MIVMMSKSSIVVILTLLMVFLISSGHKVCAGDMTPKSGEILLSYDYHHDFTGYRNAKRILEGDVIKTLSLSNHEEAGEIYAQYGVTDAVSITAGIDNKSISKIWKYDWPTSRFEHDIDGVGELDGYDNHAIQMTNYHYYHQPYFCVKHLVYDEESGDSRDRITFQYGYAFPRIYVTWGKDVGYQYKLLYNMQFLNSVLKYRCDGDFSKKHGYTHYVELNTWNRVLFHLQFNYEHGIGAIYSIGNQSLRGYAGGNFLYNHCDYTNQDIIMLESSWYYVRKGQYRWRW